MTTNLLYYKYKKLIEEISTKDGRAKKYTNKSMVGIITDEMHPYTYFIETPLLEKCRYASRLLLSLLLLFVCFLALPSLPIFLQLI